MRILGFTLCRHAKQSQALDSLWALINPEFKEKVSKEEIKVFYQEMLYFAIEVPLKMEKINDQPNQPVLDYLTELADKQDRFLYDKIKDFNAEVTKKEFDAVLSEEDCSGYRIRAQVAPELARNQY